MAGWPLLYRQVSSMALETTMKAFFIIEGFDNALLFQVLLLWYHLCLALGKDGGSIIVAANNAHGTARRSRPCESSRVEDRRNNSLTPSRQVQQSILPVKIRPAIDIDVSIGSMACEFHGQH